MTESISSRDSRPNPIATERQPRPITWWFWKLLPPAIFLCVGLLLIAAVGVAQRAGWIQSGGNSGAQDTDTADQTFTCPMHPQIRQPTAGRCPICGMALVPATTGTGADLDELSIRIEPAQRRLANIQTAAVELQPMQATIDTVGAIAIDESRMATIASYVDGRLERLFADYTGVDVAKKDHLAVVYSPELYAAQVEYLEAKKAIDSASSSSLPAVRQAQQKLFENSRRKLVELGLQEAQIGELESSGNAQSRLTIYAPIGGTVIEKLAVEGKYIEAGEPIYRIADLSTIWLMLELYPEDAARIRYGQRVEAEMQSLPGETFKGRVAFVSRTVDPSKRTVGVRVEFLNNERQLRPGDYANASIFLPIGQTGEVYDSDLAGRWISPMHPQIIRDEPGPCPICGMDLVPTTRYGYSETPVEQPASLSVPRSAVLMAGNHSVVYVETEPGHFNIRVVTLGPILRDRVVILDGLQEGEKVATAGNFLIDSQMQLAGKPSLIDPTRAIVAQRERRTPLKFAEVDVVTIEGDPGQQLEQLYAAYFRIQGSLAGDNKPAADDAMTLHDLAAALESETTLSDSVREQIAAITEHSEHLHHMEIDQARLEAFRPISHAVVTLASLVRGDTADQPLFHMYCPMVKGGAGDWLQDNDNLTNPYYGNEMLHCGEQVHQFAPAEAPHE